MGGGIKLVELLRARRGEARQGHFASSHLMERLEAGEKTEAELRRLRASYYNCARGVELSEGSSQWTKDRVIGRQQPFSPGSWNLLRRKKRGNHRT